MRKRQLHCVALSNYDITRIFYDFFSEPTEQFVKSARNLENSQPKIPRRIFKISAAEQGLKELVIRCEISGRGPITRL